MIYNKKYIRIMSVVLLIFLIANTAYAYFTLNQIKNLKISIDQGLNHFMLFSGIVITLSLILVIIFIINNIKNARFLQKRAEKEPETYLLNESALNHKINEAIELSNNYRIIHSILMLDVNYRGASKILYEIVSNLELIIRKNDMLFRMDNGYFAIVANCNVEDAISLGDKIIKRMTSLKKELDTEISVSIGVTPTKTNDNRSNLINRASKAVSAATKYGKNRVEYMN